MKYLSLIVLTNLLLIFVSCNNNGNNDQVYTKDSLPDSLRHLPQNALSGLITAEGLEVKMMASEPVLRNPHKHRC